MRVAWISLALLLGSTGRVAADGSRAPRASRAPVVAAPAAAPSAPVVVGPIAPPGVAPAGTSVQVSARFVLMTDRAEVHEPALAVTLGGALIVSLPPPAGELLLDRAAAVQRAAVDAGAEAGVWIDGDEVCVVSADGRALHHAPLPPGASPRTFAAIARSLIDEAFAPPPATNGDVRVDVHVDINAPGNVPEVAVSTGGGVVGAIAGAGAASEGAAVVAESAPPLWNRHLLELGAMVSPLTIGLEAEVAWSVTPRWRFGMLALINALPFEHPASVLWGSAAEIRRVGSGRRHFDVGVLGGAATAESDTVGFLSVRLGWTWERSDSGFGLSICPTLVFTGTSDAVLPAIWASLRWELPV